MNGVQITAMIIIVLLSISIFVLIRKIRLKRLQKERNYHVIEARFKKPNRSSEGSPY